MKRSNAPIFWLMFGAGGMLAALLGPVMVLISGLAAPLGWPPAQRLLSGPVATALAGSWPGKLVLFAVIAMFAWHAAHRLLHSLHDLGLRAGNGAKLACYGSALVLTLVLLAGLAKLGS